MKYLIIIFLLALFPFKQVMGQTGGEGIYKFLDITNSARVAALGGLQIAFTPGRDADLIFYNPSLLTDSMHNQLSVNYVNYIAGISNGYVSFVPAIKVKGIFAIGMDYINYGKFDGASETGQPTGTFGAAEYALNLVYSRELRPGLKGGINLKPIFSSFESYQSFGYAFDLGITYLTKNELSAFSLVIRNIGRQFVPYYSNADREMVPWDLQIGFSKKLAHAPLRILVTANHLNRLDLSYVNSKNSNLGTTDKTDSFSSLLMRHVIIGAELIPSQLLTFRLGYNYQRQKELAVENRPGLVGFSAGVGVRLTRFNLNFGIASYHLGSTAQYFSLSSNLFQLLH